MTGFRSYVDMYLKDKMDETGSPLTVVHEVVNDRWEVCLAMSEKGFQQVSFVNSIATTKVRLLVSTLNVDGTNYRSSTRPCDLLICNQIK